jgi:hypothetical protein
MRDFYEANKGALKMAFLMIIITIVIIVVTSFMNNIGKVSKTGDVLEKMGIDYYENYLYPSIMENPETSATVLAQYAAEGIRVTARDIVSMYKDIDPEVFYKKGNYCDFINTYVTIYPKSPYTVKDYTLKTNVSCKKSLNDDNGEKYVPDTSDGGTPNQAQSKSGE